MDEFGYQQGALHAEQVSIEALAAKSARRFIAIRRRPCAIITACSMQLWLKTDCLTG